MHATRTKHSTAAAVSPFHTGEQAVQSRLGVRKAIESRAQRIVRPFMPDQHREFYAQLPVLVIAACDDKGRPWPTLLAGKPGFVGSPDPKTLNVAAMPGPGDALYGALQPDTMVGVLGLDFATRRRNRVNGHLTQTNAIGANGRFALHVDQAFGNCPRYISRRNFYDADSTVQGTAARHHGLPHDLWRWIESADTFFLASGYDGPEGPSPARGMDASHRGGQPGFVHVIDERTLMFPDYAGNNYFNTMGNLVVDPRIGLMFIDFEAGSVLQLSGRAHIDWGSEAVQAYPDAQRLVSVTVEESVVLHQRLPIRWQTSGASL